VKFVAIGCDDETIAGVNLPGENEQAHAITVRIRARW
jgi:hypothetical protein